MDYGLCGLIKVGLSRSPFHLLLLYQEKCQLGFRGDSFVFLSLFYVFLYNFLFTFFSFKECLLEVLFEVSFVISGIIGTVIS